MALLTMRAKAFDGGRETLNLEQHVEVLGYRQYTFIPILRLISHLVNFSLALTHQLFQSVNKLGLI